MGEDNHRICVGYGILSRPKEPSDSGLNSQHLKVISRDEFHTNSVGRVTLVEVDSRRDGNAGGNQAGEGFAGLLKVPIKRLREITWVQIEILAGGSDCEQLVRLAHRESPQEKRVNKREHSGCAGNA